MDGHEPRVSAWGAAERLDQGWGGGGGDWSLAPKALRMGLLICPQSSPGRSDQPHTMSVIQGGWSGQVEVLG